MTRLWLPFGRRVLVLTVLLLALVVLLPMRLALAALDLSAQGVTARSVSGSVWAARIEGLDVSGIVVGDVDASLAPLDLLLGRARIDVVRNIDAAGAGPLSGAAVVSRNTLGIADVSGTLALGDVLAPLPVGSATAAKLSVRFEDGACTRATGNVRAMLTGSFGGMALAQGLSGDAVCDGRYVRLPLASQSGQERLDLRIAITGEYVADLIAVQPAADRVPQLAVLGFTAVPGGYRWRTSGRFR